MEAVVIIIIIYYKLSMGLSRWPLGLDIKDYSFQEDCCLVGIRNSVLVPT